MYTEENYNELMGFIRGPFRPRVGIISGLDNTDNMALMKRAMDELAAEGKPYLFIECDANTTWDEVKGQVDALFRSRDENKPRYVFINEMSLVPYFVHLSAIFADIYSCVMKIIMTGSASVTFYLAAEDELYDRAKFIKIPPPEIDVESEYFKTAVIDNILFSLNIAHKYRFHRIEFPIVDRYSEKEITEAIKTIMKSSEPFETNISSTYTKELRTYLDFLGVKKIKNWFYM